MSRFLLEIIIFVNNIGTDTNNWVETVFGEQVERSKSGTRVSEIFVLLFFQHLTQV